MHRHSATHSRHYTFLLTKTFAVAQGAPIQTETGHLHRIPEGGTPHCLFPMLKLHLTSKRGSLAVKASDQSPSVEGESWMLVLTGSSITLVIYLLACQAAVWQQPSWPPFLASNHQCCALCP